MHLLSQELWTLLASASEHPTGIPQKILDDKAEELRIKNEAQKAITVSAIFVEFCWYASNATSVLLISEPPPTYCLGQQKGSFVKKPE